jgi:hypothetical protein
MMSLNTLISNHSWGGHAFCGEGLWLAWILDWAPYEESVDKLMTQMCNKAKISHG